MKNENSKDFIWDGLRPHYCKRYAMINNKTGKTFPAACKTWRCPECGPKRAYRLQGKMQSLISLRPKWHFMTITIDPKRPKGCDLDMTYNGYTKMVWHRINVGLSRIHKFSFMWMMEFHKKIGIDGKLNNPYPHMHFLVDHEFTVDEIRELSVRCGGGVQVDIRPAQSQEEVIGYMCKYLKKEAIHTARQLSKGARIFGRSRDLKLVSEMSKETKEMSEWSYLPRYIYHTEESLKKYLQSEKDYAILIKEMQESI